MTKFYRVISKADSKIHVSGLYTLVVVIVKMYRLRTWVMHNECAAK